MENKSKGIAWVGNIYQKFESMCMEVDDMVCKPISHLRFDGILGQETLKYVEDHLQTVKQFYTEVMQEVLPSSPTSSVEEHNSLLVQNSGVTAYEDSKISVDEEHPQKELIHSSSAVSIEDVNFNLSLEQSTEDETALGHSSCFIPSDSVVLAQACEHELQDIDSTLGDTSLESVEVAANESVSKVEPEAFPVPAPSFAKLNLEESCIIVDHSELHSLINEAGERKSYKKKFRMAFSSKSRLRKQDNKQQAGCYKEKGNNVGLSSTTSISESQDMGFCESDWEII